jgi:hypothetical protein
MKRLITALLLIAMPVIALGQEATHEQMLRELRETIKRQEIALREAMVWQETVLRSQITYQLEEMRNRMLIDRMFPDVYVPRYELWLPMLMLPSLELPELYVPIPEE